MFYTNTIFFLYLFNHSTNQSTQSRYSIYLLNLAVQITQSIYLLNLCIYRISPEHTCWTLWVVRCFNHSFLLSNDCPHPLEYLQWNRGISGSLLSWSAISHWVVEEEEMLLLLLLLLLFSSSTLKWIALWWTFRFPLWNIYRKRSKGKLISDSMWDSFYHINETMIQI